ncbi:unnamed protein product [Lactuca saligna]|uniref:Uncharacterized protein n=1 Tax=Lactuca saligna TaxID=75948 RepID=A0AA36EHY8_LACSI|nr:unnamed protein product [Lactuca saligna]
MKDLREDHLQLQVVVEAEKDQQRQEVEEDHLQKELRRAEMERREGEPMLQFPESQFDEGVPIAQDDGVVETQDVVRETQFDIENANLEDQYNVVGRIGIDGPVIRAKLKPRKPSERII